MASGIVNFSKCYERQDTEIAQKLLFMPYSLKLPSQCPATLMGLCHHIVVRRSQYHIAVTMGAEKQCCRTNSSVQERHNDLNDGKNRRLKCYNCGKCGHLQVVCWQKKILREESDRTNWRSKAPEQHTVSILHKTSGNLIINGFAEGKPTSFTVDKGATVSIACLDLDSNHQPQISSC